MKNYIETTKVNKKQEIGKLKYKWQADMKRNVNLPERIDCLISEFSCYKFGYTDIRTHPMIISAMRQIILEIVTFLGATNCFSFKIYLESGNTFQTDVNLKK